MTKQPSTTGTRIERDLLGELPVPIHAYYGIHTCRALANFPITGIAISSYPELIAAFAAVKEAAARAQERLGLLDKDSCDAIAAACAKIRGGALSEEFVVDIVQGGAGTSTNMSLNEVIADRALEILGHSRGDYSSLHPMQHVNIGQSTNDVYPTAVKIAAHLACDGLGVALSKLRLALAERAAAFADVIKMGRT